MKCVECGENTVKVQEVITEVRVYEGKTKEEIKQKMEDLDFDNWYNGSILKTLGYCENCRTNFKFNYDRYEITDEEFDGVPEIFIGYAHGSLNTQDKINEISRQLNEAMFEDLDIEEGSIWDRLDLIMQRVSAAKEIANTLSEEYADEREAAHVNDIPRLLGRD